jgi:5-methylcytosine-specific restriction endonuclease McrA
MATNLAHLIRSAYWERVGETAATSSQRLAFFRRDLLQNNERLLIKSTCRNCGAVIVGSVAETLPDDEDNHVAQCSSSASPRPAAEQAGQ